MTRRDGAEGDGTNARWGWMARNRQIDTLQQAVKQRVRTSDEERKLALIRVKKGKTEDDVWTVIMHPGGIQR